MSRPSSRPSRERLLELLAEHGSATELARALGVHRVTVEKWKRDLGIGRGYVVAPTEDAAAGGA